MKGSDFELPAEPDLDSTIKAGQHAVTRTSRISAHASLRWQSNQVTHIDSQYIDNLNIWRSNFPAEIEQQLDGCARGQTVSHRFGAGEALPEFSSADVYRVKPEQFNRHFSKQLELEPRLGRFYPGGVFENIPGHFRSNFQPCRIIGLDEASVTTDFNHPLATRALDIDVRVLNIREAGQEHGGRRNDIFETLAFNGPGMQGRYSDVATDFWSDDAFARPDDSPDERFYSQPRLIDHLDKSCSAQIAGLYGRLLPHDGTILDLMSSWVSHLPETFSAARITGLGMNRHELEQNPLLGEVLVHDLNQQPRLPFDDRVFDGIICTASIEYLVSPAAVFDELARVLKPGAPLVITFSNRWFPPKAIKAWSNAHEFERMGMVLEHFLNNGRFDSLHSYSLRGLPRPEGDRYAGQLLLSDPVYAVWGARR